MRTFFYYEFGIRQGDQKWAFWAILFRGVFETFWAFSSISPGRKMWNQSRWTNLAGFLSFLTSNEDKKRNFWFSFFPPNEKLELKTAPICPLFEECWQWRFYSGGTTKLPTFRPKRWYNFHASKQKGAWENTLPATAKKVKRIAIVLIKGIKRLLERTQGLGVL